EPRVSCINRIQELAVANISADRFELTRAVEASFGHNHCPRTASEKMPVPEWMQRIFASVVRTHPTRHCRECKISDAHRLLLMGFWENLLSFRRRQHVEELG